MPLFKEWTITLKITESIAGTENPYGERELEHRIRRELEAHIPAVRMDAIRVVDSNEYCA